MLGKKKLNNQKVQINTDKENNINDYDLYQMINELDNRKTNDVTPIDLTSDDDEEPVTPINFKFLNKMKNEDFIKLFNKGLNYIKSNWSLCELKIIKMLFFELEPENKDNPSKLFFQFLNNDDNNSEKLGNIYKKDFVLSSLLERPCKNVNIVNEEKIKEEFDKYLLSKLKQIKLYSNFPESEIIEFTDNINFSLDKFDVSSVQFKGKFKDFSFNKKKLNKYGESNCIINLCYDLLKEFYPNINNNKETMKQIIINYNKTNKIYFVPMDDGLYSLTLYDGTILINKKYYPVNYMTNKLAYIATIILIYFHEIAHISLRLFRNDDNYFRNTFFNNKNHKINISSDKIITESGALLEDYLFWFEFIRQNKKNYKYLTHYDAKYIFNFDYERNSYDDFRKGFKSNRDQHNKVHKSFRVCVERNINEFKVDLSSAKCKFELFRNVEDDEKEE